MFQMKSSQLYVINGLVMLVTFFFCRVVMFPYVFYLYSQLVGLSYWEVRLSLLLGILILFLHDITVHIFDAFHHFESVVDIRHRLAGPFTTSLEYELKNGCGQDGNYENFKERKHRC
jgi:hypothetical protein